MNEMDAYDYELPKELIAQHPLPRRSDARMLVVDRARDALHHAFVRDLPEWLNRGDVLTVNDSRVIPARLVGRRESTGAWWQGLYLASDERGLWQVLAKSRAHMAPGERVLLDAPGRGDQHALRLLAKLGEGAWAAKPEPDAPALELLSRFGRVPLPPYIRDGEMNDDDPERYQTVYADRPGSVAAPTAGLHLTEPLLDQCRAAGVALARVTLHVGVGTFRPVSAERLADHKMHEELCEASTDTVAKLLAARAAGGRIVAVGTTTVRTLETAAANGTLVPFSGPTDLFIRPGYTFRAVDALLTNFHLPRSTLLVLVRTFGGEDLIRRAYETAVREEYRFFSYGDAMLIV